MSWNHDKFARVELTWGFIILLTAWIEMIVNILVNGLNLHGGYILVNGLN